MARTPTRETFRAIGAVFGNPDIRRVESAFVSFGMAEWGTWVAILVFAFEQGGPTETGLVALIQLAPAAAAAPFASVLGDRFRRDRVLLAGYAIQAVVMGATAAGLLAGAPVPVIYALAAAAATSVTLTRPIQSAILPQLSRTPDELTAANAVAGMIESGANLAGPALAGVLMAVQGPGLVFAVMAAGLAIGALLAVRISPQPRPVQATRHPMREAVEGFRNLARQPDQRLVVGVVAGKSVIVGTLDVMVVVIALGLLGLEESAAGYLTAALGAGGLVGAAAGLGLVGRRRLAPPLAAGLVLFGLPVAALGLGREPFLTGALLVLGGAGQILAEVAGRTLLQRVVSDQVLARVFGVLEGLHMTGLAVGSVVAPLLTAWLGAPRALAILGLLLPAVTALLWARLRAADRAAPVDTERIELLRRIPMFAPLPPPRLEAVASRLVPVDVTPGEVVIREGEPGDRFYVVAEGEVTISREGQTVTTAGPGEHFGEIALLRDVPRTATVTATTRARLFVLERADFLEAVTGHPVSLTEAEAVARARLARNDTPTSHAEAATDTPREDR